MNRIDFAAPGWEWLRFPAQLWQFFAGSVAALFTGKVSWRQIVAQMSQVGVGAILITVVTVGFSGAVTALYAAAELAKYGQSGIVGGLVGRSLALEVAPVITAIVVAARSGSAMAAELGSMVVTEQVDALRTMAVSPTRYLVAPRLWALLVMLPALTIFANVAGIAGGYFTAVSHGVAPALFWSSLQSATLVSDQLQGLFKTIPFALIISLVSCRQGLFTKGSARGVGISTTSAVVLSMVFIYVADFFISTVLQDLIKRGF